jgi:predicted ATPase
MPLRRIVISGCSGGGKSTLIERLSAKGFLTVAEAGRTIVRQELATAGQALPWIDPQLFVSKLSALAVYQFRSATGTNGLIFFDRCVVEPLVYSRLQGVELSATAKQTALECRYDDPIFVVPPWKKIFAADAERRHTFGAAVAEYEALSQAFVELGYRVCVIPKMVIDDRVDFILKELGF